MGYKPSQHYQNSSFDGVNDKYLISSSPAQSLPNFPASQSGFIIRVKFRLSSVVAGTEYNNNAVVTGYGYNSTPLFDSSTNGKTPTVTETLDLMIRRKSSNNL